MAGLLNALAETWPARLAQEAWSGITLPRDVYQGRVDPLSPEAIARATNLSGIMVGGPLTPRGALGSMEMMASKSPFMYNPPLRSARPFTADYPTGAPANAKTGNLLADIEGRPLAARYVVGRRVLGGVDEAQRPAEYDALAAALLGSPATVHPARVMAGDFGRTVVNRVTGRPTEIQVQAGIRPDKADMVYAHELGHAIDELAGEIPTKGLSNELKSVYNTLNNPNRAFPDRNEAASWGKAFTPQALGYKGDEVDREYMVEAIRAYMADPNYLKTVAPKSAAAVREAVNSHPTLSKIIQFNTLAALMGLGGLSEPGTSAAEPAQ